MVHAETKPKTPALAADTRVGRRVSSRSVQVRRFERMRVNRHMPSLPPMSATRPRGQRERQQKLFSVGILALSSEATIKSATGEIIYAFDKMHGVKGKHPRLEFHDRQPDGLPGAGRDA